jgi:hypothetical protein
MVIFHSYVSLPEGTFSSVRKSSEGASEAGFVELDGLPAGAASNLPGAI